jgi:hypothetical protein
MILFAVLCLRLHRLLEFATRQNRRDGLLTARRPRQNSAMHGVDVRGPVRGPVTFVSWQLRFPIIFQCAEEISPLRKAYKILMLQLVRC